MDDGAAIDELEQKLGELEAESTTLAAEYDKLGERIDEIRRERAALRTAVRSLGGESSDAGEEDDDGPDADDDGNDGPRVHIRTSGRRRGRGRPPHGPTIRAIAIEAARASGGGKLAVRDLLRRTRAHGFKSDHGGLHTYLKGLDEFAKSGPGVFKLIIDDALEGAMEDAIDDAFDDLD